MPIATSYFMPPPLPPWASPIIHVARYAPLAPYAVAPEKQQNLEDLTVGVKLVLVDAPEWIFHYDASSREIEASRGVFEVLWRCSYSYFVVYKRVFEGRRTDTATITDLRSDPELRGAALLLQWAVESYLNKGDREWPQELPHPIAAPVEASHEHVADELCLVAFASILHHEIAHHYLRHQPNPAAAIDQEREADNSAADWLLGGLDQNDPRFLKRSLGMAVALVAMTGFAIHQGDLSAGSHPRPFDRLIHSLERHVADEDHKAWGFVAGVLKLHLDQAEIPVPMDAIYPTFHAAVDAYMDALAEIAEQQGHAA
jgi:hypothetical protein